MKTHYLKCHPIFFQDTAIGIKNFEVRKNDRDFEVGDRLVLQEFDPKTGRYTKDEIEVEIAYMISFDGIPGLSGFVGMKIEIIKE
jgi:hypothetical protein